MTYQRKELLEYLNLISITYKEFSHEPLFTVDQSIKNGAQKPYHFEPISVKAQTYTS